MKVEVKEAQSNEVDWTKNPQLVVDDEGNVVRVFKTQIPQFEGYFSGVCLNNDDYSPSSINGWNKEYFKPFHGSITLSND